MSFFSKTVSSWACDVLCVRHSWGSIASSFIVDLGLNGSLNGAVDVDVSINGECIPALRMCTDDGRLCRFRHWTARTDASETIHNTLPSDVLSALHLVEGQNLLRYNVVGDDTEILANIFYWNWDDPVIVCDIDGTITKSDNRGHILTAFGISYEHAGVCEMLGRLSDAHRIVYLTGRPASSIESTREYLSKLHQKGHKLPMGPLFTKTSGVVGAVISELQGDSFEFKREVLNRIKGLFRPLNIPMQLGDLSTREDSFEIEVDGATPLPADGAQPHASLEKISSAVTPVGGGARGADDLIQYSTEFSAMEISTPIKEVSVSVEPSTAAATPSPAHRKLNLESLQIGRLKSTDVFAGAFGNSPHDKEAYESVGIEKSRVFMIDETSMVVSDDVRGEVRYNSYSGMLPILESLFPKLRDETFRDRSEGSTPTNRSRTPSIASPYH